MKKIYVKPAQKIVPLKSRCTLLVGSMTGSSGDDVILDWGGEGNPEEDGM